MASGMTPAPLTHSGGEILDCAFLTMFQDNIMNHPCPRCGSPDTHLLSCAPQYRLLDWERTSPYAIEQVFTCLCGADFTHTVPAHRYADDFSSELSSVHGR